MNVPEAVSNRLHHVGVVVSDLDRSIAFYSGLLDARPSLIDRHIGGRRAATAVGLDGAVSDLSLAFIPTATAILELIEYHSPRGSSIPNRACDVGAAHLCLQVASLDAAELVLHAQGLDFHNEPILNLDGPLAGYRWAFFSDPDAIQIELMEVPRR